MSIDSASSDKNKYPNGGTFTEEDLVLGKKALKLMRMLCLIAFLICAGLAAFVFSNVPWETRMPYDGKFNRSGNGIPMQVAMIVSLALLFCIWRAARKPDAHKMRKGSRVGTYVLGTALIVLVVYIQLIMGYSILGAGGYVFG